MREARGRHCIDLFKRPSTAMLRSHPNRHVLYSDVMLGSVPHCGDASVSLLVQMMMVSSRTSCNGMLCCQSRKMLAQCVKLSCSFGYIFVAGVGPRSGAEL